MITGIRLQNFKCFEELDLPLSNLTLLTGLNGMGKSTVLQALLVLHQSLQRASRPVNLTLAGELVDLGNFSDVLFEDAANDVVSIGIQARVKLSNIEYRRVFEFSIVPSIDDDSNETSPSRTASVGGRKSGVRIFDQRLKRGGWTEPEEPLSDDTFDLDLWGILYSPDTLKYLSAERLGPRKSLPLSQEHMNLSKIGVCGEYVFHFLLKYGGDSLEHSGSGSDPRFLKSADKLTLKEQAISWLNEVSPGAYLEIEPVISADVAIGRYSFSRTGDVSTRGFRPTNVGFGLSYVLPVIVLLLEAKPGELVILENPEAHIHPRGQTKLGQLAARAAAAGVQVIVETHSDHFMDGVRIDVKDNKLCPDQVRFHYFENHNRSSKVISPEIDRDGRLSEWPTGFFDEHDLNLASLISPGI